MNHPCAKDHGIAGRLVHLGEAHHPNHENPFCPEDHRRPQDHGNPQRGHLHHDYNHHVMQIHFQSDVHESQHSSKQH
ncbi:hypothetical protein ACOMHN_020406 [Nucella lapillus]